MPREVVEAHDKFMKVLALILGNPAFGASEKMSQKMLAGADEAFRDPNNWRDLITVYGEVKQTVAQFEMSPNPGPQEFEKARDIMLHFVNGTMARIAKVNSLYIGVAKGTVRRYFKNSRTRAAIPATYARMKMVILGHQAPQQGFQPVPPQQ